MTDLLNALRRPALLVVAIAAISAQAAWAQSVVRERFQVAGWQGNAIYNEGKLGYCVVSNTYESGTTLLFVQYPNHSFLVGLKNQDWNLRPGGGYVIEMKVDGRDFGRFKGSVGRNTRNMATFPLGNRQDVFSALRAGRQLTLLNNNNRYPFQLSGTSAALARLRHCVDLHTGRIQTGPSSISEAPFGRPDPDDRLTGGPFGAGPMEQVAAAMRHQGYDLIGDSERRENWPGMNHVWRRGREVLGGVASYRTGASLRSPEEKYRAYLERLEDSCRGELAAEIYERESWGDAEAVRAIATCEEKDRRYVLPFILVSHADGAVVATHFGRLDARNALFEADDRIVTALKARYGS